MSNSKENQKEKNNGEEREVSRLLYDFYYNVEYQQQARSSILCFIRVLNIVLVFLSYLALPNIGVISLERVNIGIVGGICLVGFGGVLILQVAIGILYNKQLFLKFQFSIYRNVLFYIGIFSIATDPAFNFWMALFIFISMGVLIALSLVIGKEGYSKNLLKEEGLPIDSYLLAFQCLLCLYHSRSQTSNGVLLFLMLLASLIARVVIFESSYRRAASLEYSILKIGSSLNVLYTLNILFHYVFDVLNGPNSNYYCLSLIVVLVLSEWACQFSAQTDPIPIEYFNGFVNYKQFLDLTQYVVDNIRVLNSQNGQNNKSNSLYSFYYDHLSKCCNTNCQVPHEVNPADLQKSSEKQLINKINRVIEKKFVQISVNSPEDVSLRLSFISFYVLGYPVRFKVMKILMELEALPLNWSAKLRVHIIKKQLQELEVVELLETMKLDYSEDGFSKKINSLMRLLVDFWAQFLEERVDFCKMVRIGERLIPAMQAVDEQWNNTLKTDNFSSVRAMKTYADYCLHILNDHRLNQLTTDYINMLHHKLSDSHELQYITNDSETAIVAISLNSKCLGKIKLLNNQACNIFNYQRSDMEKLNVNDLMPKIYSQYHDEFLKVFLTFQNKKVNTDNRLLVGKNSHGFLFQIFLQLQKSITTASDELVFVANIELAKVNQAMLLVICDEQGQIMDTNSTFNHIFIKNNEKKDSKIVSNIQELLPNFFQNFYEEDGSFKVMKELFDTSIFGVMEIKFEITKVSFPSHPEAGYIVKGYRIQEQKPPFFNNISLTGAICELIDEEKLEGMKMHYNPLKNQFIIDNKLEVCNSRKFGTQFTIPFMKIEELAGIFGENFQQKEEKQPFDSNIKTIRFCKDHFERVEQPESFQSEIDMEQKKHNGMQQILKLKEKMNFKSKISEKEGGRIINFLFSILLLLSSILFYQEINSYGDRELIYFQKLEASYFYRGQLAQYISYLEGQKISPNPSVFFQKRESIKDEVISNINVAPLPQTQKQKAMKIIELESNEDIVPFISNSVFDLTQPASAYNNKMLKGLLSMLIISIGLKFLFSFLFLKWHQNKVLKIFSLFLSQPEKKIAKIHKNCLQFLKNSTDTSMKPETCLQDLEDEETDEDENPHIKLKKFKNLTTGLEVKEIGKITIVLMVLVMTFLIFFIFYVGKHEELENKEKTFEFAATVMPQYSLEMMKAFFIQAGGSADYIKEGFQTKYQQLEYYFLLENASQDIEQKFLNLMYNNVCKKYTFKIPLECQDYAGGQMEDGISKIMNWLSSNLRETNQVISAQNLKDLQTLSIVLYDMVQPVLESIVAEVKSGFIESVRTIQTYLLVFVILMSVMIGIDLIYTHQYPLKNRIQSLQASRGLVKLLPQTETSKEAKTPDQYSL